MSYPRLRTLQPLRRARCTNPARRRCVIRAWSMGCGWGARLGAGRVTKVNGPPERARLTPRRFLLSGFTRDRETRRPRLELESTNLALAGQLSLLVSSLGLWGVRGARATQRWRPRRAARRGTRALGAHGGVGRRAGSQPRDATTATPSRTTRALTLGRMPTRPQPAWSGKGARRGQPRPRRGARPRLVCYCHLKVHALCRNLASPLRRAST